MTENPTRLLNELRRDLVDSRHINRAVVRGYAQNQMDGDGAVCLEVEGRHVPEQVRSLVNYDDFTLGAVRAQSERSVRCKVFAER